MPVRKPQVVDVFPCVMRVEDTNERVGGFKQNTLRGAEDLATKRFPLVTKWTVPTTFS